MVCVSLGCIATTWVSGMSMRCGFSEVTTTLTRTVCASEFVIVSGNSLRDDDITKWEAECRTKPLPAMTSDAGRITSVAHASRSLSDADSVRLTNFAEVSINAHVVLDLPPRIFEDRVSGMTFRQV